MTSPNTTWDASRYEELTVAPRELIVDVLGAVHHAYIHVMQSPSGQIDNLRYEDVKRSPSCFETSKFITERLNDPDQERTAITHEGYFPDRGSYLTPHRISRVSGPELPEDILVDATWQQFLPRRGMGRRIRDTLREPDYPDIFIGTEAEVARIALGVGFSEKQVLAWQSNVTA